MQIQNKKCFQKVFNIVFSWSATVKQRQGVSGRQRVSRQSGSHRIVGSLWLTVK